MTQTPLDRLKLASFQIAQWWALINALILVYAFVCGYLLGVGPSQVFLGELVDGYFDWVRYLFGEDVYVLFISPVLWLILWITTGSPRFLPWKPLRGEE